jgi:hypothetical protein
MADPRSTVRREILAEFHKNKETTAWPTVNLGRAIAELGRAAEQIQRENDQKDAEQAACKRAKKLLEMAADPKSTIRETEKLVKERSKKAYSQIAELLADLREALAGHEQSDLPEMQARKLRENYPTLRMLFSELRRKGFLNK